MNQSDLAEVLAYGGLTIAELDPALAMTLSREPKSKADRKLQERLLCKTLNAAISGKLHAR